MRGRVTSPVLQQNMEYAAIPVGTAFMPSSGSSCITVYLKLADDTVLGVASGKLYTSSFFMPGSCWSVLPYGTEIVITT